MSEKSPLPQRFADWFASRGWRLRDHQAAMLAAARAGDHALLVAATGAGKTLAGFLPSLIELAEDIAEPAQAESCDLAQNRPVEASASETRRQAQGERRAGANAGGLHTLYISPLKALAVDVQRNLLAPIEEMGLPIRVEARSGDTPADRKARQKSNPPHILNTTPESLSLLLSHPDSLTLFANLKTVIVDEIHAFASGKRGDILSLSLARLQRISPGLRRVGLSATIADPDAYRAWLAPYGDIDSVCLVPGEPGAEPDIAILLPSENHGVVRVPWLGHSGSYAAAPVMRLIEQNRTTLVFCNTRSLAELIFQQLWKENGENLPIGIHHGSLSREARRKVEAAMARGALRGLVATASLDLGVDWGDVDLVVQMGAPKGSSRLLQRIGRANHRLDEASRALVVPGNRFEYLEARAALDAIEAGERDPDDFHPGALDVLAQHIMACACAAPFGETALLDEIRSATPYSALDADLFGRVLDFIRDGGYALKAYDRFRRLAPAGTGEDDSPVWRVSHPRFVTQHRMNAGIIVDAPLLDVRFKNGRKLGTVEEFFASTLSPGDTFYFSGLGLEVISIKDTDLLVRATSRNARIPTYVGARMAMTTNLATRVRNFLCDKAEWPRFPDDVRDWLEAQDRRSVLPQPGQLLVETFQREGRHYMVAYPFEGCNAHQSLGMLLTKRMEVRGLKPLGFQASDYALVCYGLEPVDDPASLFSADILADEFVEWVEGSALLKRAFREVAVIGGLVERHHPGRRKSGKQVTFSTDLIYDVLRKYEPDHLLMKAAWADARRRLTDVGRLGDLLGRAAHTMLHVALDRVSPLAVPALIMIGKESVARGASDDALLEEAEAIVREAMAES